MNGSTLASEGNSAPTDATGSPPGSPPVDAGFTDEVEVSAKLPQDEAVDATEEPEDESRWSYWEQARRGTWIADDDPYDEGVNGAWRAYFRYYRFSSDAALLSALGENGYVFAKRRLEALPIAIRSRRGSAADRSNIEPVHEHLFYVEGGQLRDLGFFDRSGISPDPGFPVNIEQYVFSAPMEGPLSTEQLKSVPGFRAEDYVLMNHNCQDYCSAVRLLLGQRELLPLDRGSGK